MDTSWDPPPAAIVPRDLAPFVADVVGYAERSAPRVHRGLPGPWLTLVLTLDEPLVSAPTRADWAAGRQEHRRLVLGGLHTEPAMVGNPGRWRGVQLSLHPLAARRLLGLPAAALPTGAWEPRDLLGADHDRLIERLDAAPGWTQRFAVILGDLRARLAATDPGGVRPEVARAWALLLDGSGVPRVDDLAAEVGLSRRRLTTVLSAETGLAPGTAGRLVRFDRARRAVARRAALGAPLELAQVAADHGYADHSHLVRAFRDFAGLSPTAWLAAEAGEEPFPDVQAPGRPGRAA